jgi:phage shock protein C
MLRGSGMTEAIAEPTTTQPKRFHRSKSDRKIAGVCGGMAEYLNLDPTLVRILWIVAAFMGGIGLIAYLIFWIAAPEK